VVFEVMVIEVIRISRVITNAGVVRIRLPIRNGFIRLASEWSGGSAAIAEEVSSTEDTNRELLADHGRTGGIPGEGGNEWGLGAKESKVSRDVSVIDREEH
jgi:hypothetical protein